MKIEVSEIVGEYAIGVEDGEKLYEFICFHLSSGQEVELDFTNILVNATFFCYAIAQLFKDFEPRELDLLLKFRMPTNSMAKLLQRVIDHGKKYYSQNTYAP